VVICLEWCADLHMAQLMPLPLAVSCFRKIQIGFTFLVPAHLVVPDKGPLYGCVCGCVCVCVHVCVCVCLDIMFFFGKTLQCSSVVSRFVTFSSVCWCTLSLLLTCCWPIMLLLTLATCIHWFLKKWIPDILAITRARTVCFFIIFGTNINKSLGN